MKQFEFRLQKVMETTKTRQELKKRELAKALAVLTQNELLLEGMLERLEEQAFCSSVHFPSSLEQTANQPRP